MLSKAHRLIALAIITLIFLAYFYRGAVSRYPLVPTQHLAPAPTPTTIPIPAGIVSDPNVVPDQKPSSANKWNYADLEDAYPSNVHPDYPPVETGEPGEPILPRRSPYAYVFWATSDEYACAAIVNINRLIQFHTRATISVLVTRDVTEDYRKSMEELGASVHEITIPQHPAARNNKGNLVRVENSLMRLAAFRMHQIENGVKRVIVMDSDVYIYQSLDSLFELPEVDVAATRDLYAKSKGTMLSNLMLITPNDRTWNLVEENIKTLAEGQYSNYLINKVFGDSAMIIPGQYFTVDKHWLDWTIPAWYHHEEGVHAHGMVDGYSESSLKDLWKAINTNVNHDETRKQVKKRDDKEEPVESLTAEELLSKLHGDKKETPASQDHEESKKEEGDEEQDGSPEEKKKEEPKDKGTPKPSQPPKIILTNPTALLNPPESKSESPKDEDKPKEEKPEEVEAEPSYEDHTSTAEAEAARLKAEAELAQKKQQEAEQRAKAEAAQAEAQKVEQEFKPAPKKTVPEPPNPYSPETHPNREDLGRVRQKVVVLHYGAMGKPWANNVDQFKKDHLKRVHPDMVDQLRDWREVARTKCPRVKKEKEDGETEWFHFVNNV